MVHTSKLSAKGIPSEVRDSLVLGTGDLVGYEIRGEEVVLKRVEPSDAGSHAALAGTLEEWGSPEDDEAFRHL
jgi:antitoxin PrlF